MDLKAAGYYEIKFDASLISCEINIYTKLFTLLLMCYWSVTL
jgi:hypothetical protein